MKVSHYGMRDTTGPGSPRCTDELSYGSVSRNTAMKAFADGRDSRKKLGTFGHQLAITAKNRPAAR